MRLRGYKEYIENGSLIIKTAERTRFGSENVYQEVVPPKSSNHLTFESSKEVQVITKYFNLIGNNSYE